MLTTRLPKPPSSRPTLGHYLGICLEIMKNISSQCSVWVFFVLDKTNVITHNT
jgi:tryptophanyl-tRNA synthetase